MSEKNKYNDTNYKDNIENTIFADDNFYYEIAGNIPPQNTENNEEQSTSFFKLNTTVNDDHKKHQVTTLKTDSNNHTTAKQNLTARKTPSKYKKNNSINSITKKSNDITVPKTKNTLLNIDALDGLRALAIISVILYHLNFKWAQGGLLGVTIFFVLSGYLITGIISKEIKTTGKIDLKRFWIRRIRRLFPAIVTVIFIVMLLCILFNHILLTKMKPDVIPSLFWFQNWWYIIRDLSYFDNLGAPSPLVHFWSLAIEEQFYIFWPLILLVLYKLKSSKKTIRRVCLILATISVILMFVLYNPDGDPTRVYYGTDTRAFSLLLGAWLSFVCPINKYTNKNKQKEESVLQVKPGNTSKISNKVNKNISSKNLANVIGIISLISLLIFMIFIDGTSPAMFRGIILLASICSMGIIYSAIVPNTFISYILSFKPLIWIGKRSYGIYLWHVPIFLLLQDALDCPTTNALFAIFIIAITICIAALQYKYIEEPIRRGKLSKNFKSIISEVSINKNLSVRNRLSKKNKITILSCVIVLAAIIVISIAAINTPDEYTVPEDEIQSSGSNIKEAMYVEGLYYPVLVGDSVTGNLDINQVYPKGLNDSVVNRKLDDAINVVKGYQDQSVIANVLIVSCFSNHEIIPGELDTLYSIVKPDQELFLVTPYTPHPSAADNTAQIKDFDAKYDNVHIIDWAAIASSNKETYLYQDDTHLKPEGQQAYLNMLINAINDYLPENVRYKPPDASSDASEASQTSTQQDN